eukprot:gnl/TRDRNA2_/TRDRNA2_30462_c0_seq2.p1 gnl/TRDRNA2_/TRDRNA2_30462_c0~~gnl/TRDRNA2_/TRDRNA2_30462_c0_seq2.p1  ORF type:complete len:146 (+),score=18.51 gnl/TRDRNA2_/TRDRNA2_30462_c0_seq2:145-582(+)
MDAAGIFKARGVAEAVTVCILASCIVLCILVGAFVLGEPVLSLRPVLFGVGMFGILSFSVITVTSIGAQGCDALCRTLDWLQHLIPNNSFGLAVLGVIAAVVAAVGVLMAPVWIYRRVLRSSRAGLHALEEFVLDIRDADPSRAD